MGCIEILTLIFLITPLISLQLSFVLRTRTPYPSPIALFIKGSCVPVFKLSFIISLKDKTNKIKKAFLGKTTKFKKTIL